MTEDRAILVIDDDESISSFVQFALEDEGFRMLCAGDGAEALQILQRERPRLILLDMRMPRMNGWQFAEAYRTDYEPRAPIVVLTAAADAAQRAAEIRAEDYLGKPFDVDHLIRVVQTHAPQ